MAIRQHKDGRWGVKYTINSKQKWKYFGRGIEAEQAARDRNDELKEHRAASGGILAHYIDDFLKHQTPCELFGLGAMNNQYRECRVFI